MFAFTKPTPDALQQFLAEQAKLEFTYQAVGATATTPPEGYNVDHTRHALGEGEATFDAAVAALRRWEHFNLGWVEAWPIEASQRVGEQVAVVATVCGLWVNYACRIVYEVDEQSPIRRVGFAYGTLPGHAESGEERFTIEWDRRDNRVTYDILAFSRPNYWLARLAYPLVRHWQYRFAQDSGTALLKTVKAAL